MDWTRGLHGIRISFPHPSSLISRRRLSATYLPDVCTEQNWSKEQCLESLMRKAGYDPRAVGGWSGVKELKVERYRALKARTTWEGYLHGVEELKKLN
jgi:AMME syndrome candidate gene 1 protein